MLLELALAKRAAPRHIFFHRTNGMPALRTSLAQNRPHKFPQVLKPLPILSSRSSRARVSTVILNGCPAIYFRLPRMGERKLKMNIKPRNVLALYQPNSLAFPA